MQIFRRSHPHNFEFRHTHQCYQCTGRWCMQTDLFCTVQVFFDCLLCLLCFLSCTVTAFRRCCRRSPGHRYTQRLYLYRHRNYNERHRKDTKSLAFYTRPLSHRMNPCNPLCHRIIIRPLYNPHCDIEISLACLSN